MINIHTTITNLEKKIQNITVATDEGLSPKLPLSNGGSGENKES